MNDEQGGQVFSQAVGGMISWNDWIDEILRVAHELEPIW